MFALYGDNVIIIESLMPSIEIMGVHRDRVAVAVKAIELTFIGIKLCTSPTLNKVSQKGSSLYNAVCM